MKNPAPHLDFEELAQFAEDALPPERAGEVQRHLDTCEMCSGQLDQWLMNEEFLGKFSKLGNATADAFPEAIHKLVFPKLEQHFSSLPPDGALPKFRPNEKRSHPDAPNVPDYVLIERLGEGSFGVVWDGEDLMGQRCAIKVLFQRGRQQTAAYDLSGIQQAKERQLPQLVPIRHVGRTADGEWYYVMDFIPHTLAARLRQVGKFSAIETGEITTRLLEALAACHQAGIAHRDIKPENVGFAADGRLILLDLGLVTGANRTGRTLIGSPDFMPHKPSQTPALDDLYAAGMILYCLLTGAAPVPEIPPPLTDGEQDELWSQLYTAARKATALSPADRFPSADEFLAELNAARRIRTRTTSRINGQMTSAMNNNSNAQPQHNSMKTKELLTEAAAVTGQIGQSQRQQKLLAEANRLRHPRYKVAVVGEFKVGKSNLINQVFLKRRVLFTDVLAATAVPTEIEYGEQARLEVYPNVLQTETVEVEGKTTAVEIPVAEGQPKIIENPTPEIIQAETAASDTDPVVACSKRASIAKRTARVRLQWPSESLGAYTIVDTPGINEPNDAVVATTYRVIPEADATVFVMLDRGMGELERDFLKRKVFDQGLSRCLVVVNASQNKPQAQLDKVIASIRGNLHQIGREYVPVQPLLLPPPLGADGSLPVPSAEEQASLETFQGVLKEFLDTNVEAGRRERARSLLIRETKLACAECEVELAALSKSPEELASLNQKITDEGREFQRRYRKICQEFLEDFKKTQRTHWQSLAKGLDDIGADFANGFDQQPNLKAVQTRLQTADALLRPKFEELFFNVSDQTMKDVRGLEAK